MHDDTQQTPTARCQSGLIGLIHSRLEGTGGPQSKLGFTFGIVGRVYGTFSLLNRFKKYTSRDLRL
jgi:uncharacterized protein with LGFP repeats